MSASILIPAYNEERGIAGVIEAIKTLLPHTEVIVIDDGSTDETARAAKDAGAKVVRHPANAGYGRSLKSGIVAATHDAIVITDADGTYPIDRIPDLLASLDQGFDMVVGARTGKHYRGSLIKMPARIFFKWIVEYATGRHIPDINSGLRAFRRKDVLPFFPDLCDGFSFTTTITLLYFLTGKFVRYLSIRYEKRVGKSKVRFLRDTLRTLQYITEVLIHFNPLKLFLLLILITLIVAAIATVALSHPIPMIIGVALAILLTGMGFVAEALRYRNLNNR